MTAIVFSRPSVTLQRSAWLRSADMGIETLKSILASMESTTMVMLHQGVAIQTLQAILEDFTNAGKSMDDMDKVRDLMTGILRRVADIIGVYEALAKETGVSQLKAQEAATRLSQWLTASLPLKR